MSDVLTLADPNVQWDTPLYINSLNILNEGIVDSVDQIANISSVVGFTQNFRLAMRGFRVGNNYFYLIANDTLVPTFGTTGDTCSFTIQMPITGITGVVSWGTLFAGSYLTGGVFHQIANDGSTVSVFAKTGGAAGQVEVRLCMVVTIG